MKVLRHIRHLPVLNPVTVMSVVLLAICACSTTKVLDEGQYRLAGNRVKIEGRELKSSDIEPYIRQKASWSPLLYVYNWSRKDGRGLWSRVTRSLGAEPVVYDSELVGSSIRNIEGHLSYMGYYGSMVDTSTTVRKKRVRVDYRVVPGKRYEISEINYFLPGEGEFAGEFMRDSARFTLHKGDKLSEDALNAESTRMAAYMRNRGYYRFNKNYFFFSADTLSSDGKAILDVTVANHTRNESVSQAREHKKFTFGEVQITYPKTLRISNKLLQSLNSIYPGEPYSETVVSNTYSRLSSLSFISNVNINLSEAADSIVNCSIDLSPAKLQGFKLNLEASSNSIGLLGISPELSYYHRNIFHGGEVLNLSFMGNFQLKPGSDVRSNEFGLTAGLLFPKFLFLPYSFFNGQVPKTEIKTSFNYQDRPEYQRRILSASYGYSVAHRHLYYQLYPLQLSIVKLSDMDNAFYSSLSSNPFMKNAYQNHFDIGSGLNLYYTDNTDVNPKTSYKYLRLQLDASGNIMSLFNSLLPKSEDGKSLIWGTPYSQYVRAEIQLGKTWKIGSSSIATRLLCGAGYAYGNSEALPFEKHFYSGGASSLRGWQARSIGPGFSALDETFVIPSQTGDLKLEANLEYRFHMFWKFDGALFTDVGNVWSLMGDDEQAKIKLSTMGESLAADWGLGLRLDLNVILIRLDMGVPFHDPSRAAGMRWVGPDQWIRKGGYSLHFGVGYPF